MVSNFYGCFFEFKLAVSRLSPLKLLYIGIPLNGQQLLFGVVTLLAARNDVSFGAFTATGYRHDMIHGQPFGRKGTAAIVADPFCQATFPPLGLS